MRIQKYVCHDSACRKRNGDRFRVWYRHNSSGARVPSDAPRRQCPSCGSLMRCSRLQKSTPRGGRSLDSSLAQRTNPDRDRRRSALESERKLRRQQEIARRRGISLVDEDPEDDEYAPPPQFNPNMRLTSGSQRKVLRSRYKYRGKLTKVFGRVQITSSHTRSSSSTNQNAVMGGHLVGTGQTLSAWQHAGRTPYSNNRYVSAEWCHLVADCLGGPTALSNLVAASFAANTEMMAIENLLMGKTRFSVMVEARCLEAHVAERVYYHVYCKKSHPWSWKIDGQNDHFTRQDLDDLREELKDFITSHKNC